MKTRIALDRKQDGSVIKMLEVHLESLDLPIDVPTVLHDAGRIGVRNIFFPDFVDCDGITPEQAIALSLICDEGFTIRFPREARLTLDIA